MLASALLGLCRSPILHPGSHEIGGGSPAVWGGGLTCEVLGLHPEVLDVRPGKIRLNLSLDCISLYTGCSEKAVTWPQFFIGISLVFRIAGRGHYKNFTMRMRQLQTIRYTMHHKLCQFLTFSRSYGALSMSLNGGVNADLIKCGVVSVSDVKKKFCMLHVYNFMPTKLRWKFYSAFSINGRSY